MKLLEKSEKPIFFSTDMVEETLSDRKTKTRRVIKPQPTLKKGKIYQYCGYDRANALAYIAEIDCLFFTTNYICIGKLPYIPGDILWVRETWQYIEGASGAGYAYKAGGGVFNDRFLWKPSIHMPREAARLFLRVTDVKAEQLWDITEEDAIAEGCRKGDKYGETSSIALTAKQSFMWLWQKLYDRRDGCAWASNPWVWVIEFERINP
jgi:hypothetical protein